MKTEIKKLERLENHCLNTGKGDLFKHAYDYASDYSKPGKRYFTGIVRQIITWAEAGILQPII